MAAKITAEARLRTLELYLEHRDAQKVARILTQETGQSITGSSIRVRLNLEGVGPKSREIDNQKALERIKREVEKERAENGPKLPWRSSESDPISLDDEIALLEAFIANGAHGKGIYTKTGAMLGLTPDTVKNRLGSILGVRAHIIGAREVLTQKIAQRDQGYR